MLSSQQSAEVPHLVLTSFDLSNVLSVRFIDIFPFLFPRLRVLHPFHLHHVWRLIFGFSSAAQKARLYVGIYILFHTADLVFLHPVLHYLQLRIHPPPVLLLYPALLSLKNIYHEGKFSRPWHFTIQSHGHLASQGIHIQRRPRLHLRTGRDMRFILC